jgi:uncharacterized protein (TIGR02117 family)
MLIDRLTTTLAALFTLPLAYLAAAFLFGLTPTGVAGRAVGDGVEIFLVSNGWHVDLLLPMRADGHDWRRDIPPGDFRAADPGAQWIAFGWGDRAFYLETTRFEDLRPLTAAKALLGVGPAVLHVTYARQPTPGRKTVRLVIDRDRYRRLVAYLAEGFRRDAAGRPIAISGAGYGPADGFYDAQGAWGPLLTCNEWIARGLRQAGIRAPLWAPLPEPMLAAWR